MRPFLPTPSSYPRLAQCLGSMVLPNVEETHEAAGRGSCIHAYLEAVGLGVAPDVALAKVPAKWREDCAAIPLEQMPDLAQGTPELAMAWDPYAWTFRILGQGYTRETARAAAKDTEVSMLADWAALTGDRSGILVDWKSSWGAQAPAAEHLQLLTYGSVYLLAAGLDEVQVWLCRPDRDNPHWDGPVLLDREAAEAHLSRIGDDVFEAGRVVRQLHAEDGRLPPLSVGPWCDYCPSRRHCPAQVSALLALLDGSAERAVSQQVELTDEQAGRLWFQLGAAAKTATKLRDQLAELARRMPLPLPDGTVLRAVDGVAETPLPEATETWLRDAYGDTVATAAMETITSWSRIQDALEAHLLPVAKAEHAASGAKGRGPTKTSLLRDVRADLVAAGAVAVTPTQTLRAVRPQPTLPEAVPTEAPKENE